MCCGLLCSTRQTSLSHHRCDVTIVYLPSFSHSPNSDQCLIECGTPLPVETQHISNMIFKLKNERHSISRLQRFNSVEGGDDVTRVVSSVIKE